ncbi:putative pentatricopeptide repeat protein [Daldinia childiae]|uniref:putative pentatricopeptide repeat protein n=1 Tax=Daldinia childiae TaxID=326645 RepID=UPI001444C4CA|nr:putative pentatricopeptide repeat protein [Daldinia childiae]KAF3057987.1 putative pentatricopeptide repeat protein [Daldinia childiae]
MQFGSTFENGIRIVQSMHNRANRELEKLGKNVLHPQPSVYTYTILMTGLRNHKHTQGVIVTLNMMIKEGIVPNIVTWNAVIGALLQKGYIEEAVRVMRNLKQVGLESNARTVQEITNVSKVKRKWVATLMRKLDEKPTDISDQRLFAKSLLRRWEKPDDQLIGRRSTRRGYRISHGRHGLTQPSTAFSDAA